MRSFAGIRDRLLRRRGSALALVLALGLVSVPASGPAAGPADDPRPRAIGTAGIGDPYWPWDGNRGIDVLHYDIRTSYDFATGKLAGATTLTIRATTRLTRFQLDFLLAARSVTVDGVNARFGRFAGHELDIVPRSPIAQGRTFRVRVTYNGRPGSKTYAGERNWLADGNEVVTMNQPHMAPWWFPANDHPRDKATYDITVTGPITHQVVSNGLLVDRTTDGLKATTHWRSTRPMASYLAFFALGRYDIAQGTHNGLPWYVAVSQELDPSAHQVAMDVLEQSPEVTAWLTRRLGAYPFESTGGLTTSLDVGFALENQTRPIYPRSFGSDGSVLVHELAHQWFGDSVSVRRWRDIWLNEGFATFMEAAYDEKHGGPSATRWLKRTYQDARTYYGPSYWRLNLADPGPAHVFDDPIYTRGGLALQALRNRVGNADFWKILRTWVRTRRHGHGSVPAFEALAKRISGKQLDGFFRAWLRAPRPPARTRANGLR